MKRPTRQVKFKVTRASGEVQFIEFPDCRDYDTLLENMQKAFEARDLGIVEAVMED